MNTCHLGSFFQRLPRWRGRHSSHGRWPRNPKLMMESLEKRCLLSNDGLAAGFEASLGAGSVDTSGPHLTAHDPAQLASDASPLNMISFTFTKPIDLASFETDGRDLELKNPQGALIAPVAVKVVSGSSDMMFVVTFADQSERGEYRLAVGPDITDTAGKPMNQDGDLTNGEAADDQYSGTVNYAPSLVVLPSLPNPPPNRELYAEDFESWPPTPTHWRFQSAGTGTV